MKYLLLLASLAITGLAQAQGGTITFERKTNLHKSLPPQLQGMASSLPEFNIGYCQVVYNKQASLYKELPTPEHVQEEQRQGGLRIVQGDNRDRQLYIDYTKEEKIDQTTLDSTTYLVTEKWKKQAWTLTSETKDILGHTCRKATSTASNGTALVAWYTTSIPCSGGPAGFGGLPGLILELHRGDDEIVYMATQIEASTDEVIVTAPTKGQAISREAYSDLLQTKYGAKPAGNGVLMVPHKASN